MGWIQTVLNILYNPFAAHPFKVRPDSETVGRIHTSTVILVWGLNLTVFSNMVQFMWHKGKPARVEKTAAAAPGSSSEAQGGSQDGLMGWLGAKGWVRSDNRNAGPCRMLFLAMLCVMVENTWGILSVAEFDVGHIYTKRNGHWEKTHIYYFNLAFTWIGLACTVLSIFWYILLQRHNRLKKKLGLVVSEQKKPCYGGA